MTQLASFNVAHDSSHTESRYALIEQVPLAVQWGILRAKHYLIGNPHSDTHYMDLIKTATTLHKCTLSKLPNVTLPEFTFSETPEAKHAFKAEFC